MASSVLGKRTRSAQQPGRVSKRRAADTAPAPQIHRDHDSSDSEHEKQQLSISPTRYRRSTRSNHSPSTTRIARSKRNVPQNDSVTDENAPQYSTPKKESRFKNALPVTPRHRVQVAGKPITPRTPRTISTPSTATTVYTPARQLFARSANPGRLVGRDNERTEISNFIHNAIESRRGGCLYVSGPPGTGKSALVSEVCHDMGLLDKKTMKVANINCASMTSSRDIYGKLVEDLCDGDSQVFKKSETDVLRDMFVPKQKKRTSGGTFYLIALDEIDHLITTDLEILYTLFEYSMNPSSHLILIGIANALDLTDRFLPRLKAKNLKPTLLPFLPYTAPQISGIVTAKLRSLIPANEACAPDYVPFVHPAAIQLCSRKVASQTGDLRKAFDLIRRTIDLIERETQQKQIQTQNAENNGPTSPTKAPLVENVNLSSTLISPPDTPSKSKPDSSSSDLPKYTVSTAPRATVAHIARITSSTFGNGTTQRLQGLNLQQKAALCALISLGRKSTTSSTNATITGTPTKIKPGAAPTSKEIFETYTALCRRDKLLAPLTSTEFRDVLSSLDTLGLVGEVQMKTSASTPTKRGIRSDGVGLACYVSEKEMMGQIGGGAGEGILRGLLREECYY